MGVTKKNTAAAESFSVIMLSLYWVLRKVLIKNLGFTQIEIKKSKIKGIQCRDATEDLKKSSLMWLQTFRQQQQLVAAPYTLDIVKIPSLSLILDS